ncbi:ArsR/SmtB family transcription factor [Nocardia carnea]|uniref:ArsR/SmtB family transcription factor n=1 Tax=Nocardia carnea TaxID=37328 RepID=UPI0024560759|nr:ArsR family transcriptional regulator [Nocardia carnea]
MPDHPTTTPDFSKAGEPLPEPTREELRLETVLAALSDPLRLGIVRAYYLESGGIPQPCGWFPIDRPKSTRTHHWRVLREAGLIRQWQHGMERRNVVRVADLDDRFPGLLNLVAAWEPPD